MKNSVLLLLMICIFLNVFPVYAISSNTESTVNATTNDVLSSVTSTGIDLSGLTCQKFLTNETHRNYIEMMLKYYINVNSKIQSALLDGQSAIFMFEGGSDYYNPDENDESNYDDALRDVRKQATVIVVQVKDKVASIKFYSENCSSIPGDPKFSIQVDGIYQVKTWNHQQTYGALQIIQDGKQCIKAPDSNKNGYWYQGEGINIHTRSSQYAGGTYSDGTKWYWSEGCQVIGSGTNNENIFNKFMKDVTGIDYDVWIKYTADSKKYKKIVAEKIVGYYIIDRQLALSGLKELYNDVALEKITKASTEAHKAALDAYNWTYLDECTTYPAYCTITATADTRAMTLPCSTGTNADSAVVESVDKGSIYTAIALILNDQGNHWYQIETAEGKTAYLPAGKMNYVDSLTTDLSITGATAPTEHKQGKTFAIAGKIQSAYNEITKVSAYVYKGTNTSGDPVTGGSDTVNGKSYSLKGSDVDSKVKFATLSPGTYTYAVYAHYKNYYADTEKTSAANTGKICLYKATFTVTGATSCSHSYEGKVTTEATCKTDGVMTYTCKKCGATYTESISALGHSYDVVVTAPTCTEAGYTTHSCDRCGATYTDNHVDPVGHSYESVRVEPGCTEDGSVTYTCHCGHMYVEVLYAYGHSYEASVTAPTCTEAGYTTHTCSTCGDHYTDSYVDAVGHSYETVRVEPTCDEDGSVTYTCHCGDTYTEVIPATGHSFVDGECEHCGQQEVALGDVNGDGRVNARDARLLLRYIAGLTDADEVKEGAADFNGDSRVNARDARAVLRFIAGLE